MLIIVIILSHFHCSFTDPIIHSIKILAESNYSDNSQMELICTATVLYMSDEGKVVFEWTRNNKTFHEQTTQSVADCSASTAETICNNKHLVSCSDNNNKENITYDCHVTVSDMNTSIYSNAEFQQGIVNIQAFS